MLERRNTSYDGRRKKINFYRLGLENGRRYRMELTDEYRLTGTGGGVFLYLAPVYDSRDRDGSWHRLILEGDFIVANMKHWSWRPMRI